MSEDLTNFRPKTEYNRREFIVTTLAGGFALAVQPVSAQTITTDTNGLVAGEVKIPVAGGEIPAYRAMPAKGKSFPVVLVVQEIFGVHEHIKDLCRRMAKAGHMAIAPELYARQGDVSKLASINEIRPIVMKVPDAQVMSDLDATVMYAKKSGSGNTAKLGITGFCWGGRIVWLYAAHNPNLKAGVAWYGRLVPPQQISELQPKHPTDVAAQLKASCAWALRRERSGHPAGFGRTDASGDKSGWRQIRDHRLPGSRSRLQRRLPSDLQQGSGSGRLATNAGVVQEIRRGVNIEKHGSPNPTKRDRGDGHARRARDFHALAVGDVCRIRVGEIFKRRARRDSN